MMINTAVGVDNEYIMIECSVKHILGSPVVFNVHHGFQTVSLDHSVHLTFITLQINVPSVKHK